MYGIYMKSPVKGGFRYEVAQANVSLFGCNNGWIPWLLAQQMPAEQNEPYRWHLDISRCNLEGEGRTLIIDLKPNNKAGNLSLYEICDVWGLSDAGWTPIMLRLRALYIDHARGDFDDKAFTRAVADVDESIFSFLYLDGSVADGKLRGKWTAPRASPTNSALLWPETFMHFQEMARPFLSD